MSLPDKIEIIESESTDGPVPKFEEVYSLLSTPPQGQSQAQSGANVGPYLENTSTVSITERGCLGGDAFPVSADLQAKYKAIKDALGNNKVPHPDNAKEFDEFFKNYEKDQNKGDLEIPDTIVGLDGKEDNSEDAKFALQLLTGIKEKHPDLVKIWTAARYAGIEVRCVDNIGTAMWNFDPKNPRLAKILESRENDIKNNVMELLNFFEPAFTFDRKYSSFDHVLIYTKVRD